MNQDEKKLRLARLRKHLNRQEDNVVRALGRLEAAQKNADAAIEERNAAMAKIAEMFG